MGSHPPPLQKSLTFILLLCSCSVIFSCSAVYDFSCGEFSNSTWLFKLVYSLVARLYFRKLDCISENWDVADELLYRKIRNLHY